MADERDIEYGLLADDIAAVFFSEAQRTYRDILATRIALRLKAECEKARAAGYAAGTAEATQRIADLEAQNKALTDALRQVRPCIPVHSLKTEASTASHHVDCICEVCCDMRLMAEVDAALAQKGGA